MLTDKTGLTGGLSRVLATDRLLTHDRGRVLVDLAWLESGDWSQHQRRGTVPRGSQSPGRVGQISGGYDLGGDVVIRDGPPG